MNSPVAAESSPIGPAPPILAIVRARIYSDPEAPPLERGTIIVRDGRISEVGPSLPVPSEATVLHGEDQVVTAGFWNAHVHFTESHWANRSRARDAATNAHLAETFTSRGFTSVVDAGSDPRFTFRLRDRIRGGELEGPAILTAGPGLYPPRGIPFYLKDSLPRYVRWFMPQPSTPAAATRIVRRAIARGVDLVKLFTGSYVEHGTVLPMPGAVARAAVEAAHAGGRLVYAHPSNLAGTRVALESGVDVLAHAPDATEGVDESLLRALVARRMAMIPTLKMFGTTVTADAEYLDPIYRVVRRFHEIGGTILFGTDVGYMRDYSTDGEFEALRRSGLDWRGILRALTTAPAERFGLGDRRGRVAVGQQADLVVLDGDPAEDPSAFARVRSTIRRGRLLWTRP